MRTKEVLTNAKALIERGWTQGAFAYDTIGKVVDPTHSSACTWCIAGAVWRVVGFNANALDAYRNTCSILDNLVEFNTVSEFNDHADTTQADVLSVFDEALARCEDDG